MNHKRVYQLYRQEGLAMRRKERRRSAHHVETAGKSNPLAANERWAMDFVSDSFSSGRKFRTLTIVDEQTRECPALEVDTSLPGKRVIRVLEICLGTVAYRKKYGGDSLSKSSMANSGTNA